MRSLIARRRGKHKETRGAKPHPTAFIYFLTGFTGFTGFIYIKKQKALRLSAFAGNKFNFFSAKAPSSPGKTTKYIGFRLKSVRQRRRVYRITATGIFMKGWYQKRYQRHRTKTNYGSILYNMQVQQEKKWQ